MLRFAGLALAAGIALPVPALPQEAPAAQRAYGFCSVTDTSHAKATIWASPVFPVDHGADDPGGIQRSFDLAEEFLAHVGTLGGQGDKQCVVTATEQEAAANREEQRSIWDKRMYMVKIGDWRNIAWTPAPWTPAQAAARAAPATRYFLCQATQTDLPDRSDLSRTVATGVFSRTMPSGNVVTVYERASAYSIEFQTVVHAHGLPVTGVCMPYDTAGEAQYAYQQMLRFSKGFNKKYTEVAWTPSGQAPAEGSPTPAAGAPSAVATATNASAPDPALSLPALGLFRIDAVTRALSDSVGMPSPQGVFVSAAGADSGFRHRDVLLEIAGQAVNAPGDIAAIVAKLRPGFQAPVRVWRERAVHDLVVAIPQQTTQNTQAATGTNVVPAEASAAPPAAASASRDAAPKPLAEQGWYCAGIGSRTSPAFAGHTPVRKQASAAYSDAEAKAVLSALIASVRQSRPGPWHDLPEATCFDNSAAFAGERFCVAATTKRFGGGTQLFGLFCNASRDVMDKRWQDMQKSGAGRAEVLAWPADS
jgi:hypothetical protein